MVWLVGVVGLAGGCREESPPGASEQRLAEVAASCTASHPLTAYLCLAERELSIQENELRKLAARIDEEQARLDRALEEYDAQLEKLKTAKGGERKALEAQLARMRAELRRKRLGLPRLKRTSRSHPRHAHR